MPASPPKFENDSSVSLALITSCPVITRRESVPVRASKRLLSVITTSPVTSSRLFKPVKLLRLSLFVMMAWIVFTVFSSPERSLSRGLSLILKPPAASIKKLVKLVRLDSDAFSLKVNRPLISKSLGKSKVFKSRLVLMLRLPETALRPKCPR